jgi:hypothetical protein
MYARFCVVIITAPSRALLPLVMLLLHAALVSMLTIYLSSLNLNLAVDVVTICCYDYYRMLLLFLSQ